MIDAADGGIAPIDHPRSLALIVSGQHPPRRHWRGRAAADDRGQDRRRARLQHFVCDAPRRSA